MGFFSDDELDQLRIDQAVFHIVGPSAEHLQLLEAFNAGPHSDFFLGRVQSVNSGNRYTFLPDAAVRTQLARILANRNAFQGESENLAQAFHSSHLGSSSIGAFLIFALRSKRGHSFALLKFEDEKVLSYDFVTPQSGTGRPSPKFGEILRTFVQNRNALQKAALIRLGNREDEICVVDRQNPPHRPAAYFEQFLGVRRLRSENELTRKLVEITQKVARKNKDALPSDTMKTLAQRLFDATRSGGAVDGERVEEWFRSIVGPLPDESPVLAEFRSQLKRERIAGESFTLERDAVAPPRNRRVETAAGVKLSFPASLQNSIIRVDDEKGEILIRDKITVNELDIEISPQAR